MRRAAAPLFGLALTLTLCSGAFASPRHTPAAAVAQASGVRPTVVTERPIAAVAPPSGTGLRIASGHPGAEGARPSGTGLRIASGLQGVAVAASGTRWAAASGLQGMAIAPSHALVTGADAAPVTLTVGIPRYVAPDGRAYVAGATAITLQPTATFPVSGSIRYQIDGDAPITYTAPFTAGAGAGSAGDGAHAIAYWAVDNTGAAGTPQTVTLNLDTTPPVVTPLITGAFDGAGVAYTPVTVSFTATDSGSGLSSFFYYLQPTAGPGNDNYTLGQQMTLTETGTLDYQASDDVGNYAYGSVPITVAIPSPTATIAPVFATSSAAQSATAAAPGTVLEGTPTTTPSARPMATPGATRTPRPSPTTAPTRTPRPTPTWPPIDGPPLLTRPRLTSTPTAAAAPPHMHVMPPIKPTPSPHRRSARACRRGHRCTPL